MWLKSIQLECHGRWLEIKHYQMWHHFPIMLYLENIELLILLVACESFLQDFHHLAFE
jgi:hypothetical protein